MPVFTQVVRDVVGCTYSIYTILLWLTGDNKLTIEASLVVDQRFRLTACHRKVNEETRKASQAAGDCFDAKE